MSIPEKLSILKAHFVPADGLGMSKLFNLFLIFHQDFEFESKVRNHCQIKSFSARKLLWESNTCGLYVGWFWKFDLLTRCQSCASYNLNGQNKIQTKDGLLKQYGV